MNHAANDWKSCLERFRPYLRMLARLSLDLRLRAKLDPSDVVQEAMLNAWEGIERFKGATEAEFGAWLRRILANQLAEEFRKFTRPTRNVNLERSLHTSLERSSACLEALLSDNGNSPELEAQRNEQILQMAAALDSLALDQRTALEHRYFDQLPVAEIAGIMQRTESSVTNLLYKGLRALRSELNQAGEGAHNGVAR
jgi:RNA polymerase sigma-70 factor (ECF subfamily)